MKILNFNWSVLKRKLNIQVALWNNESADVSNQIAARTGSQKNYSRFLKLPIGGGPVPGPYSISAFNSQLG
jgi:hypothetical protein